MKLKRILAGLLAGMLVLPMFGCSGDPHPKDSAKQLRMARAEVITALKDVAARLSTDGANATDVSGSFSAYGSPMTFMEYAGGGKVTGDDRPIATRIEEAAAKLKSAGWKVTYASTSGKPAVNLAKGGLRLSLRPDALRGSEALSFGITSGQVRATNGQVSEFDNTDRIIS